MRGSTQNRQEKFEKILSEGTTSEKLTPGFEGIGVNGGHFGTLCRLNESYYVFVRNLHPHRLLSFSLQYLLLNHDRSPRVGHKRAHGFLADVSHPILGFHTLSHE
jgi:hypothetical protein